MPIYTLIDGTSPKPEPDLNIPGCRKEKISRHEIENGCDTEDRKRGHPIRSVGSVEGYRHVTHSAPTMDRLEPAVALDNRGHG